MSHECFADEIAIDFPSVGRVVERMRDRFLGEAADACVLSAEVSVSRFEARRGHVVPIDVPVSATCEVCGGRGETWAEPCAPCFGTGASHGVQSIRVPVPPGVADGAVLRVRLVAPDARPVRLEVRVVIRPAAV